ncbi:MAG: TolC family protein [Candidatus Kapaibacterium sp.]
MKKILITLAAFLTLPVLASAQDTTRLSLGDAINAAIKTNRDLQLGRIAISNAEAQIDEAYATAYPSVTITSNYQRNLQRQVFYFPGADGITRPIKIGSDNVLGADATVNQIVYNAALSTAVETAREYGKISRQALRTQAGQTVLDVKRAYYTALFAREALRVNETLLANAEENLKNAQLQFKVGLRPEFDAIRAEVQAANQRPVVIQSRDSYQQAIDNLRLVVGLTGDSPIALTESLTRPVSLEKVEPAVADARAILERNNAQLQTLKLTEKVNEMLVKIKKADYLPTVSFIGRYSLSTQFDNVSDISFQPTSFVGLNLSYNIFSGWRTDAQVREAQFQVEQSKLRYDQAAQALSTQIGIVLRKVDYARQRISTGDLTINQAQRAYTIATTSYRAGTGTQLAINDADLALAQAKLNQLNAVYDFDMALSEVEGLLGDHYQLTDDNANIKYEAVPGQ